MTTLVQPPHAHEFNETPFHSCSSFPLLLQTVATPSTGSPITTAAKVEDPTLTAEVQDAQELPAAAPLELESEVQVEAPLPPSQDPPAPVAQPQAGPPARVLFPCRLCGKVWDRKGGLMMHLYHIHEAEYCRITGAKMRRRRHPRGS